MVTEMERAGQGRACCDDKDGGTASSTGFDFEEGDAFFLPAFALDFDEACDCW